MLQHPSEIDPLVRRIMEDYEDSQAFFSEYRLPEYAVLNELEIEGRERALFLTLTCVTNHIHDGTGESKKTDGQDGLWRVCGNLWRQHQWIFLPEKIVGSSRKEELVDIFTKLEIMDDRDPDWWFQNARTIYNKWDSDPRRVLRNPRATSGKIENPSYDAPSIEQVIKQNKFPALGGKKILPLWLRMMHEEVHQLERIEEINIPVDFHIVNITNRLRSDTDEFSRYDEDDKETIRDYWYIICQKNNLVPIQLDKPLWLLNKYWNQGGRVYVAKTLGEIRDSI
jgi:hypothetical protein